MCGIAGFYGFKDDSLIKKFSHELEHRGPDGEGFYIDKTVSLLNRRLAIIDVKGGDQPIYNEDKSIVIVYNGEIYNYLELRKELEYKHKFKTKSDTEVIVHAYEQWGENCFDKFNGMFAIALYDLKNKKLILARDHFGIKPLYYASTTYEVVHGLMFSSEIKPLLYSGLIEKKPNDKVIYRYLHDRVHDDTKETFFEGIYRLLPGEKLIMTNGNYVISKFTQLENDLMKTVDSGLKMDDEKTEEFKDKLTKAIKYRLISEVPVGTCLSGGLDSSTVVAVANSLLKKHVKESESLGNKQNTFSAVFPGSSNDEEKYIDSLIKNIKTDVQVHKIYPKPEEFFNDIQDFVRTQEEPTISTGPYAQYKVMQKAHEYVTVLLDGQGSDEMMAGYLPYYFVYLKELPRNKKYLKLVNEILNSFDVLFKYGLIKLKAVLGLNKTLQVKKLLNTDFYSLHKKQNLVITSNSIKKRLIEDIFHNSLQSLLRYEDKNAMRFSIEGRVPFLDFELLKYIFSLDTDAIIKNGWNKFILRQATTDILPEIINKRRNKIGFTTPEYEWFMKMKNRIYTIFMSDSFTKRKYFRQQEVVKSFKEFIEGKNNDTMVFWRMLNVELWMREFFDVSQKSIKLKVESEKSEFRPNEGKKLEIETAGKKYLRFPIRTDLFKKGDDYAKKIANEVKKSIVRLFDNSIVKNKKNNYRKWFVVVSEKIVAISQGRSYFIWDIKPSFWANLLSKFVKKTPFGIGLGSPWTMQIAIQEVSLPRILLATLASVLSRPLGIKGIFYKVAGPVVRSIDGPTEYSLYPSNVSAKLGPKEPQIASQKIHDAIITNFQLTITNKFSISGFQGVVIIDANDIGRDILGNTTNIPDKAIAETMRDNPMGQADEQTPIVLILST